MGIIPQGTALVQDLCAGESDAPSQPILIAVNRDPQFVDKQATLNWERHTTTFQLEVLAVPGIAEAIYAGNTLTAAHYTRRHSDNLISVQHWALDYDHNSIAEVLDIPFVKENAAIVHTTSSHTPENPRCRAFGILDQPIRDAKVYVRLMTALLWKLGQADPLCKDACRNWFGALGCEMVVRPGKVLPVAVLEAIADQYDAWLAEQERAQDIDPTIDPTEALDIAVRNGTPGQRNITGFWLACRCRDAGISQAQASAILETYQLAVGSTGEHPYTLEETRKAVRSAYSRRPRGHTAEQIEKDLALFEWLGWKKRAGAKEGGIHYSLKSLMFISEIAREAGRTQGLDLPTRDFNRVGVPRSTAARHLKAMVADGLLKRDRKSNRLRATTYSINLTLLRDMASDSIRGHDGTINSTSSGGVLDCPIVAPIFNLRQSPTYHKLQPHAHFRHRARIDWRLWVGEPPDEALGPALQRILATLAECSVRSRGELYRLADVNQRTGKRQLRLAMQLGLVAEEFNPEDGRAKVPYLVENWYERLCEIEPALTTYGHDALLSTKYEVERVAHFDPEPTHQQNRRHYNLISTLKGTDKELAENAAKNARERFAAHKAQIKHYNERRRAWAASQGIQGAVPGISLQGPPKEKKIRQPYAVARFGRYVIPTSSRVKTGKNRPLLHERDDYMPPIILPPEVTGVFDATTGLTTWTF